LIYFPSSEIISLSSAAAQHFIKSHLKILQNIILIFVVKKLTFIRYD